MSGTDLGLLLLMAMVLLRTLPAVRHQWRSDRKGFLKSVGLLVLFMLWCIAGAVLVIAFAPPPGTATSRQTLAATGVVLALILFGGLWLIRLVPHYRPVPPWLLRPLGVPDLLVLGFLGLSAVALVTA